MNYRNSRLLEVCRLLPCMICDAEDGTVVAAHSNQIRDNKGMGIKADDFRVAALCHRCHMSVDRGGGKDMKEAWEEAHRKTIGRLFLDGHLKVC